MTAFHAVDRLWGALPHLSRDNPSLGPVLRALGDSSGGALVQLQRAFRSKKPR